MKTAKTKQVIVSLLVLGGLLVVVSISWRASQKPSSHAEKAQRPAPQKLSREAITSPATAQTEALPASFLERFAASLKSIQEEADDIHRAEALSALAEGISLADIPAALDYLSSLDPNPHSDMLLRLVHRWTAENPQASAEWVSRMRVGLVRRDAINIVAIVWANQNVSDATQWLQRFVEVDRQSSLVNVAYEAARVAPLEALRLAMILPADDARDDLVTHVAAQWAAQSPQAAAEWGKQIAQDELRGQVISAVALTLAETDPQSAAALAVQLPESKQRDDAVVGIVQRWVQKDAQQAAAWVVEFPEGALRNTALEELTKLWTDQNAEQAGKWLGNLSPGAGRDAAIGAYAEKMAPQSPEVAAQWAMLIEDERRRYQGIENVAEAWMAMDAPRARAWVSGVPVPDAIKQRLLTPQ